MLGVLLNMALYGVRIFAYYTSHPQLSKNPGHVNTGGATFALARILPDLTDVRILSKICQVRHYLN